ncbi:hypothetical protein, partial [Parvimonas sp. M20]|uniref:hypothetical protein n=1 Tax=Parvimonas sp. M20 TaxID=3110693 RepID=UPI002B464AD8
MDLLLPGFHFHFKGRTRLLWVILQILAAVKYHGTDSSAPSINILNPDNLFAEAIFGHFTEGVDIGPIATECLLIADMKCWPKIL